MLKQVEIFTDGSCLGNPGPGGYGAIMRYRQHEKTFSAGYRLTTNNRMELMAAIVALEALKEHCEVVLSTDSQYVRQGITQWIHNWKKRGWKIALAVGLPLVLLGGGFLGYSLYAWNEIETAQAYEQYTQAYEWYERAPWLWELDEQRGQYTAAWVLVERRELSEAAQAFRELGDYADSGELAEKCNTYIRAQTVGSPFTKYKLYNNLGGFLDSSRQAQAQIPEIYDTALEHYGENRFSAAMEWLEIIPDYENYEDAFVYVEACKAHTVLSENYYKMTREVQNALEMLEWSDQYIDVEPICMDRYLIDYFLDGTWVAVDGDVFEYAMENNEFDFWYRYVPSGKYNFESDGMYYASSGTRFAAWDYISYNEIVITFESDGRSYHYYRQ